MTRFQLVFRENGVDRIETHDNNVAGEPVIDGKLIVEAKSTELLPRFASRQAFNYLKASHLELGLILHFGPEAKVHRLVHTTKRWQSA